MDATQLQQENEKLRKQNRDLIKENARLQDLAIKYSNELERLEGLEGAFPVLVRTKFAYLRLGAPSPNGLNRDVGKIYKPGRDVFNIGRGPSKPTWGFDMKMALKARCRYSEASHSGGAY